MGLIRPSPVFLLSFALSLSCQPVLASSPMADVFTPAPPPAPAECLAPAATPKPPSSSWLADYLGTPSGPVDADASVGLNGMDGVWWPRGKQLQYIARELLFRPEEVSAGGGFRLDVPDNEIWRINWIAVDWITNMGSGTRFFLIQAYDFLGSGFGYYIPGKATPGDNDGGSVTWMPGVQSVAPVTQQIQEPLPRPLWLYPNWRMQIQINNGGADFLNSLRGDIERWLIVTAPSGGGGSGGGGGTGFGPTGGGATGGPYFAPAP